MSTASGDGKETESLSYSRKHYQDIVRFFIRKGCSPEDAEDLAQAVLSKAIKSEFNPLTDRLDFWLLRIAQTTFTDWLRKDRSKARVTQSLTADLLESMDEKLAAVNSSETAFLESTRMRELDQAISQLPKQMQAVVILRVQGKTYRVIAELLRLNEKTVRSNFSTAMSKLKQKLVKHGSDS